MTEKTAEKPYQLSRRAYCGLYEKAYLLEGIVEMYRDTYDKENNPNVGCL